MSPGAFDASKSFTTRDGRAVSGLYRQPDYVHDYIYEGRVENLPSLQTWASDGSYIIGQTSCLDLINVLDVSCPVPPAGGGEDEICFDPKSLRFTCVAEIISHSRMAGSLFADDLCHDWAIMREALSRRSASQATRYEAIQMQCAHFGGTLPGRCLFTERDWAPGMKPVRCAMCPDAIRALKQEPASDGWLPIDSAPRDGTWVLLWWPYWHHQPCVGYYTFQKWKATVAVGGDDCGPTHWQPLPAPPHALKQGGQE